MKFRALSPGELFVLCESPYFYGGHKAERFAVMELAYTFGQHRIAIWHWPREDVRWPDVLLPNF